MFLAEAAVQAGERDDARKVVADLERLAAVTPAPMMHVHLCYARAILADDTDAAPFYADLVAHDLPRWPWARARAELAYGGWLRRQHRYREASEALRATSAAFARIGAVTGASLARAELSATGTAGRNPRDSPPPGTGR
jgi:hypothetical protein